MLSQHWSRQGHCSSQGKWFCFALTKARSSLNSVSFVSRSKVESSPLDSMDFIISPRTHILCEATGHLLQLTAPLEKAGRSAFCGFAVIEIKIWSELIDLAHIVWNIRIMTAAGNKTAMRAGHCGAPSVITNTNFSCGILCFWWNTVYWYHRCQQPLLFFGAVMLEIPLCCAAVV